MISNISLISIIILCLTIFYLFTSKYFNKSVCVLLISLALWLPLYNMFDSLGHATNIRPEGMFKIITSIVPNYENSMIYILVKDLNANNSPRLHKIVLNREAMQRLQDEGSDYAQRVFRLAGDGTGAYDVVYVDYTPPDLQKGDTQRSYQNNAQ